MCRSLHLIVRVWWAILTCRSLYRPGSVGGGFFAGYSSSRGCGGPFSLVVSLYRPAGVVVVFFAGYSSP